MHQGLALFSASNVIQLLFKDGGGEYTGREESCCLLGKGQTVLSGLSPV